jgi:hypothetical protein
MGKSVARFGPPHSARTAIPPTCSGPIDMRAHTKILSALRSDSAPVQTGKES